MCKSKAEGGQRCATHQRQWEDRERRAGRLKPPPSPWAGVKPMPWDYQPERGLVSRMLFPTLKDSERRLFWLREQGYAGPVNRDGYPVPDSIPGRRPA